MRTTVSIEESILKTAKRKASEQHISLAAYVEKALREKLSAEEVAEKQPEYRPLPTFRGTGLQPGIDIFNSRALLDTMDENR